jgi:hypothetical protein
MNKHEYISLLHSVLHTHGNVATPFYDALKRVGEKTSIADDSTLGDGKEKFQGTLKGTQE